MALEKVFLTILIILVVVGGVILVFALTGIPTTSVSTSYNPPAYQSLPQPVTYPVVDSSQYLQKIKDLQAQLGQEQLNMQYYKNLYDQCRQTSAQASYSTYSTYRVIHVHDEEEYNLDRYDLVVTVKDDDGDRIEDAHVRVENDDSETEYTDEDGEARFDNLYEDCYDIRVSKAGYHSESEHLCLRDDEHITIRLERD